MKNIKNYNIFKVILLGSIFLLHSCGILFYRNIECREFQNNEELRWFVGNVGDTVTFFKQDNTKVKFEIVDKYILHMKQYISDTGCGCSDRWGLLMKNDTDTISMYSDAKYVYNNPSKRYDKFYILSGGIITGFVTEDKVLLPSINIDTIIIKDVVKFTYNHKDSLRFNSVYVAKDLGIIKLERVNGEVWINKNLTIRDTTSIKSFEFSEQYCN